MFSTSIAISFLLLLSYLFSKQGLEVWVIASYFIFSFLTFLLYGIDKRNAIKGDWRISEKTLQVWALLGGWPGALLAHKTFRHKTQKRSFILMLWLGVLMNILVFTYFFYLCHLAL